MSNVLTGAQTVVIVGCGRSGSTSLFQLLAASPEIAQSKQKEPGFYLAGYYGETVPPQQAYDDIFSDVPAARLRLEATAAYFYSAPEVPDLIEERMPEARIVIIFREPHARLRSEFGYLKTRFRIDPKIDFESYVDKCMALGDADYRVRENMPYLAVRNGCYDRFFPYWSEKFSDRMRVVFNDDLSESRERLLAGITDWLGVSPIAPTVSVENKGRSFRFSTLQRQALQVNTRLEPFFRRHPQLKAKLRDVYYRANGAPQEEDYTLPASHPLYREYEQSLHAFRDQLLSWNSTLALPGWLRDLTSHTSAEKN